MKRKPFGDRLIGAMQEGLTALRMGKPLAAAERPKLLRPPAFTKRGIVRLRTSYGLTQKEFSNLVMVSPKTIQSWEQGTRKPSGAASRILQILSSPNSLDPVIQFKAAAARKGPDPARK